jgi:DNA polymerase-3 subunit alpha
MPSPFIHLKVHSEFSMVDGIVRLPEMLARLNTFEMPAVAVTDHANLFALVKFYCGALKQGIKPIVGADVIVEEDGKNFVLTVFAKNQAGYKNLTKLVSKGYVDGQIDGEPRLRWEWIEAASEGLILLSGGHFGDIGQALLHDQKALAEERLKRCLAVFPNHFYIELQRTEREGEEAYIHAALELAEQYQVPVVATNDVRFLNQEDFEAHEARVCIHDGYVLDDSKRPKRYSDQQYLKSAEQMQELFSDIPEALENTVQIAKRCSVQLHLGEAFLPNFPIPDNFTLDEYFRDFARKGLQFRLGNLGPKTPEELLGYDERLRVELDVIINMGFPGYFLIVADFIRWAKENDIPVGPGRGSGAGSLVAYALLITELDPLEHELLFERFLNPERVSMPDFDIDFCMENRDRVIEYVADKYGHDSVSQIITYGTMAAKAVVRDVGRVLGYPYGFVDKVAKLIPFELGITLQKALDQEDALLMRYRQEEEVRALIDLAKKLEGITRNAGKHAGGVVIAPTKLTDFTPLYCEAGGEHIVTQFDKDDVEKVGLVKFDFLGLRTLTIIHWALKTINKKRREQNEDIIDIKKIPLDDEKTFSLLKDCQTTAVFQLESRGMKELIRRLLPDCFDEITALVALFRPGPLQSGMVDDFIDRKHGRSKVEYPHPELEPILKPTYGIILYQEQVMQIAQVLAGYTLGGADILRRAMGKKKPEEMAKQRVIFTGGATARGIDEKVAEHIFDLMEKFAGYGFNKSHSAAYALVSYQTVWLKTHFPAEFMAAVLSSDMDNTDKVVGFVEECKAMKLPVIPPDVNAGFYQFTVNEAGRIVYGLGAIKGVGESILRDLEKVRATDGKFKNIFNFCQRLDVKKLSKRAMEPLVRSGALDVFKVSRASLFASIGKALKSADQQHKNTMRGQNDLFGESIDSTAEESVVEYVDAQPWVDLQRLKGEREVLGFYVTGHPWQVYEKELTSLVKAPLNKLKVTGKDTVVVAGILLGVRHIMTKAGKKMAILTLEDRTGRLEVTLFSEVLQTVVEDLIKDAVFVVRGSIANDDFTGGIRMVAESILPLSQVRRQMVKRLLLGLEGRGDQADAIIKQLPHLLSGHLGGNCAVTVVYRNQDSLSAELRLGDQWKVIPSDSLLAELHRLVGACHVSLEYH